MMRLLKLKEVRISSFGKKLQRLIEIKMSILQTMIFLDQQPFAGKSYYRLKLVETSGSFRYSQVKWVEIDQRASIVKLYPNPAKNSVRISLTSAESHMASLQLKSFAGQTILKKSVTLRPGENNFSIELATIPEGMYNVEIITSQKTYSQKLIVWH